HVDLAIYDFTDFLEISHSSLLDVVFSSFHVTATSVIYTLSLHDALPISALQKRLVFGLRRFLVNGPLWYRALDLRYRRHLQQQLMPQNSSRGFVPSFSQHGRRASP